MLWADWRLGGTEFGASLAAGDVNNDGVDDLVIGAPGGESLGSPTVPSRDPSSMVASDHLGTGVVALYHGDASDILIPHSTVSPTSASAVVGNAVGSQRGARFGDAIAVSDIDGDGKNDLVVGAPLDPAITTIGSQQEFLGQQVLPSGHVYSPSGRVYVLEEGAINGGAFVFVDAVQEASTIGSRYGGSLLIADVDSDSTVDVAIGAPGLAVFDGQGMVVNAGGVFVYEDESLGSPSLALSFALTSAADVPGDCPEPGDELGFALGFDEVNQQLLVAAPGDEPGCGPAPTPGQGVVCWSHCG